MGKKHGAVFQPELICLMKEVLDDAAVASGVEADVGDDGRNGSANPWLCRQGSASRGSRKRASDIADTSTPV